MRINNKHKIRDIAGEKVIIIQGEYSTDLTKIVSLNSTSEWLWKEFADKDFEIEDVVRSLTARYKVEAKQAEEDARKWIDKLVAYQLIEK
ncbi:MAG TPA: PqqD family protein [Bacteroidales bacterium]|jgi:hypothetical protein|nr:PqqD family protein [Bacteroidales bacterium]